MLKWLIVTGLTLSLLFCAWRELEARRRLSERRAAIAAVRAELEPLRAIAGEVDEYVKQREALQQRIDAINRQKLNQKVAADAVATLSGIDASVVESVAVVGGKDLVVNRR